MRFWGSVRVCLSAVINTLIVRHISILSLPIKFTLFFCFFIASHGVLAVNHQAIDLKPRVMDNAGRNAGYMRFDDWLGVMAAHNNPFFSRQKLHKVYQQLLVYSGKKFRVYPFQTNLIGLAKPGGKIIIDIAVIGKSVEVLAFWLAHEWGHQDLGHAMNRFTTPQMAFNAFVRRRNFPTSSEDEADVWAAQFLAHNHYHLEPVLQYFCGLKNDASDKHHSSWQQRARNITQIYNQITGRNLRPFCASRFVRSNAALAWRQ